MRSADVGDDGVSDDGRNQDEEHDNTTELEPIGYKGDNDCHDCCNGVGNDRPELGLVGCIAQFDDDGGEEETE